MHLCEFPGSCGFHDGGSILLVVIVNHGTQSSMQKTLNINVVNLVK